MDVDRDDVLARFEPVVMTEEQASKVARLRSAVREYAAVLCDELPHGRNKALALTSLEESAMWATKAITHG